MANATSIEPHRFRELMKENDLTTDAHKIVIEAIKGDMAGIYLVETLQGYVTKGFRACLRAHGYSTEEMDQELFANGYNYSVMTDESFAFAIAIECELKNFRIKPGKDFENQMEDENDLKTRRLLGYTKEQDRSNIELCAAYYHEVIVVVLEITREYLESEGFERRLLRPRYPGHSVSSIVTSTRIVSSTKSPTTINESGMTQPGDTLLLRTKHSTFLKLLTKEKNPSPTFLSFFKSRVKRELTYTVIFALKVIPTEEDSLKVKLFRHEAPINVDPYGVMDEDLIAQLKRAYLTSLKPSNMEAEDDEHGVPEFDHRLELSRSRLIR